MLKKDSCYLLLRHRYNSFILFARHVVWIESGLKSDISLYPVKLPLI